MREHDASPLAGPPESASPAITPLGRRRFLQVVGLGLTQALTVPAVSFAQSGGAGTPPRPASPAAPAAPAPAAPPAAEGPPAISEDARSLAEIVKRRYGQHLTPDQLEAVTRQLDQGVQGGRRLRDVKLANGDEPDFTFRVERP